MRRLIYVPIIHSEADMGSLAGILKNEYEQKYGREKWRQHLIKINNLWSDIEECFNRKHLCYRLVRIYQDGLPVCGNELQIVKDIANKGSKNHRLLLKLVEKGATLMGTEDPVLLMKEYQLLKDATAKKDIDKHTGKLQCFMSKRDSFIAGRISETLKKGETGILFMGMLHQLENRLPSDIYVEYIRPPDQ